MKIQCDVCNKEEASVFCVADEASLCAACDHRVHHANKVAGKHQRFSLHHPEPNQPPPLCDICLERRAFLFCQQDRAILCTECDIPIHKANSHTQKHTRFLLTGLKLSANCSESSNPSSSESAISSSTNLTNSKVNSNTNNKKHTVIDATCTPPSAEGTTSTAQSSISEYLIEMLPGWHVEDFLDSPSPYAFYKNDLLPLWDDDGDDDDDLQSNMMKNASCSTSKMGSWVPQAPPPHLHNIQSYSYQSVDLAFGLPNGLAQDFTTNNIKFSRNRSEDNSFAVPQIIPNKKSRNLW